MEEAQQFYLSKSIGSSLNTDIKYISSGLIRIKKLKKGDKLTSNILIIIGKEKVYGYNLSLDSIKFEFSFDKIAKVEFELYNPNTILIELDNYKIKDYYVPLIVLIIDNREMFLKMLQCYYSSYHAEMYGILKDLKTKNKDQFEYENKKSINYKTTRIKHDVPDGFDLDEFLNYK